MEIVDKRGEPESPDEMVAIPNDFTDKYMRLFKGEKQLRAILDLIGQAYRAGVQIEREYRKTGKISA